jgi:hypothetical protein
MIAALLQISPNGAVLAVVTSGVGAVMIRLGIDKGVLQPRRAPRKCASCSRLLKSRVCANCTGS